MFLTQAQAQAQASLLTYSHACISNMAQVRRVVITAFLSAGVVNHLEVGGRVRAPGIILLDRMPAPAQAHAPTVS